MDAYMNAFSNGGSVGGSFDQGRSDGSVTLDELILTAPTGRVGVGVWSHVAGAYDSQTGAVLYVNGEKVAERRPPPTKVLCLFFYVCALVCMCLYVECFSMACVCERVYVCVYVWRRVCINIHTYTHTHTHIHTHTHTTRKCAYI
jgi:hypothetical protein